MYVAGDTKQDPQGAQGGGSVFLIVLAVVIGGVFLYALTQHLGVARPGDLETRLDTWNRLEQRVRGRRGNDGTDYYAASCMFSSIRSIGSPRQGEPNPHFKLAACRSGVCDYAIIGVMYDEPAIVTARGGVPITQYKSEVRKDLCISVPVDDVLRILNGNMP